MRSDTLTATQERADTAASGGDKILFVDLKSQYNRLKPLIDERIHKVLDHGAYVNGPEITELETTLAERTGANRVIAVASGTDALLIPMMAEGIGEGDAVFLPAFTYNATANAVIMAGAVPVFVDIDPQTFNMDPDHLEHQIDATIAEGRLFPRAIVPVDLFGLPADYKRILKLAEKHNLFVLADSAQSLGGALDGQNVGSLAPVTATSFFPSKTLGAYGDAGAIFSRDGDRADIWESIRWHGTDDQKKESIRIGMNGRMDSMQAAVLLSKLSIFDEELAARRKFAAIYTEQMSSYVQTPVAQEGALSAWGLYSIVSDKRADIQGALKAADIPSAVYYAMPLHKHRAFAPYAPKGGLPQCEAMSEKIMTLPLHPYMTEEQVMRVSDVVCSAVSKNSA